MATVEHANKDAVRRYYDAWNAGDIDAFDQFFAPDFVDRNGWPDQAPGAEGVKQAYVGFRAAFPDFRTSVDDLVAEGDRVVVRTTLRATHLGPFQGRAPTGSRVTVEGIGIFRMRGGRAVERWGVIDALGFLRQLGAAVDSPSDR